MCIRFPFIIKILSWRHSRWILQWLIRPRTSIKLSLLSLILQPDCLCLTDSINNMLTAVRLLIHNWIEIILCNSLISLDIICWVVYFLYLILIMSCIDISIDIIVSLVIIGVISHVASRWLHITKIKKSILNSTFTRLNGLFPYWLLTSFNLF